MATCLGQRSSLSLYSDILRIPKLLRPVNRFPHAQYQRSLKTSSTSPKKVAPFAFAFDIDGVLLRSSTPLPRAHTTLSYLQTHHIPFILLTNGGGKHESERVHELSRLLDVPLDTSMFVQSHTPFAELVNAPASDTDPTPLKEKNILVVGGDGDKCRHVAESYGFNHVLTPSDILAVHPSLWPFSSPSIHTPHARPFPSPLYTPSSHSSPSPHTHLAISAIFIYADPRSWAPETQLILDLLLSHRGILGTTSPLNNRPDLPNRGFQGDGQPRLYFSNPDLWWASSYHLPRLGQGGFREALEGVWAAVTGGVQLQKHMFGKPEAGTYGFAERRLEAHRQSLTASSSNSGEETQMGGLETVYMIGDNPASDIRGANSYTSPSGRHWRSVLVRTGVFSGEDVVEGEVKPDVIVKGVGEAVEWALREEGWKGSVE